MLSGDVESNPGPNSATPSTGVSTRKGKEGKEKDESSLAMILENLADLKDGQACMKENQNQMLRRLCTIETDLEKLKSDYVELVKKHEILQERVKEVKQEADESYSNSLDMNFSLDRLEQYSRKSSIRVLNVKEDKGENVEELVIRCLKDEINVDICPEEIDIAHHVGRAYENKPRSILVKFISHKSNEKVIRRKKEAKL